MTIPIREHSEVNDWARYGGAHRNAFRDVRARSSLRPGAPGDDAIRDDPFRDYRSEGTGGRVRLAGEDRRRSSGRRSRANLIGAATAVVAMVGLALVFSLRASEIKPSLSPSRPVASESRTPSATPVGTIRMASAGFVLQLAFSATAMGRDFSPDDGRYLYLAGDGGAAVIDPDTGQFVANPGGSEFPSRLRKWIFNDGLWLSTWLSTDPYCGPACWQVATTYRVDAATGAVTLKLPGTYLVGRSSDGIWVASGNSISRLDPATGQVAATVPWQASGEPRFGCNSMWSFRQDSANTQTLLSLVDLDSGLAAAPVALDPAITSGPISVEGYCWAMSGSNAASNAPVKIVWLSPNGSVLDSREANDAVVVMDNEFWTYKGDGTLQRLDMPSGVAYGHRFQLDIRPSRVGVSGLFAALGLVWLCEGDQLVVFDIRTGATNANR